LYFEQQDTTALLYITSFRPSAPVQILNLNSRQLTSLPNTEVSLADGILQNPDGSWLVSSWQENTIYMFKPDWSARTRIDEKVISPADIYLNPADHELCIPQFNTNQITFVAPIEPKSKAGVPAAGR
jgi:hypothetical protein